jgi:phosphoglycolate phosphatase-like HAD superfamily hydrolase
MKLSGAIFDLDGTLGNTFVLSVEAFREAFAQFTGRQFTDEEIIATFGPSELGSVRQVIPDPDRREACLQAYMNAYEQMHKQYAPGPFPGIKAALDMLQAHHIPLAVVTGKAPDSAWMTLKQFGLTGYFDIVETGSPDGPVKPLLLRKVLKVWNVPADQVIYVGDAPSDVTASREVGVIPLGAGWADAADIERLAAQQPAATFHKVDDLIKWIGDTLNHH